MRQHFGIRAPRMAVRTPLPWWGRLAVGAGILAIVGAVAWWIDVEALLTGFNRRDLETRILTMQTELDRLRQEGSRLRERASQLDSELAMTKGAQNTLTRQVNDLTGENTQLKEELAFLQRLFADSSKQTGLWIPRMTLERENEEAWHYSLLIARGGAQSDDFQGHVGLLAIVIPPDGAPRTLSVPDEQPDLEKSLALKFKYYQRLEGTLRVPAGAKVTALTARVYDGTGTSPRATRTLTNP